SAVGVFAKRLMNVPSSLFRSDTRQRNQLLKLLLGHCTDSALNGVLQVMVVGDCGLAGEGVESKRRIIEVLFIVGRCLYCEILPTPASEDGVFNGGIKRAVITDRWFASGSESH